VSGLRASVAPGYNEKEAHMKVIDTPRTNKIGTMVAYVSPYGQCYRTYCVPRNPRSFAQTRQRGLFGSSSRRWGRSLTELQRQHWDTAAEQVPSHPSLRQYAHLTGEQLYVKIDSTLRFLDQPPLAEPPTPVVFGPNPVASLLIDYDAARELRLRLSVGPLSEDLMLFGQPPCNSGRRKLRRVYFLGLVGPATNGLCDITAPYIARFGTPAPGRKVFILTSQHRLGWRGPDSVVSALVLPPVPAGEPLILPAAGPEAALDSAAPEAGLAPL
jgi:hypothetical protein